MELLVASLFSDEAPLAPPSTGLAGFLRFLLLLAGHDWATAPLLVDPQGELSAADRAAAAEAFSRSRDRGKRGMCLVPRCAVGTIVERRVMRSCRQGSGMSRVSRLTTSKLSLFWGRTCCATACLSQKQLSLTLCIQTSVLVNTTEPYDTGKQITSPQQCCRRRRPETVHGKQPLAKNNPPLVSV